MLATGRGVALRDQGKHAESLALLQESYELHHQNQAGVIHSAMQATHQLAMTLTALGRNDEAEDLLRRKVEDCRRELGDDHERTLFASFALGVHLYQADRLEEAHRVLSEAEDHFASVMGEDDNAVLFLTEELAEVLKRRGEVDEAERLFRKVLEGRRLENPDDVLTYVARVELAEFLASRGKLDEAEALFREQLVIQRRLDGPEYPLTLWALDYLVSFLAEYRPGRRDEAESLALELVATRRRVLGDDHENTQATLAGLAELYDAWGEPEKAAEYRALLREAEEGTASD
jgi:tetratricopeptide (TPR) repeat protein